MSQIKLFALPCVFGIPGQQIGQRIFRRHGTFQPIGGRPRFRIQVQRRDPRAVLSPVVLFFEQQRHFAEPVIRIAVFAEIIFRVLAQSQQRHGALVFDRIRHFPPLPFLYCFQVIDVIPLLAIIMPPFSRPAGAVFVLHSM